MVTAITVLTEQTMATVTAIGVNLQLAALRFMNPSTDRYLKSRDIINRIIHSLISQVGRVVKAQDLRSGLR
jgi:hypothetical protein